MGWPGSAFEGGAGEGLGEGMPVKQRKRAMLEQTWSCWFLVALFYQEKCSAVAPLRGKWNPHVETAEHWGHPEFWGQPGLMWVELQLLTQLFLLQGTEESAFLIERWTGTPCLWWAGPRLMWSRSCPLQGGHRAVSADFFPHPLFWALFPLLSLAASLPDRGGHSFLLWPHLAPDPSLVLPTPLTASVARSCVLASSQVKLSTDLLLTNERKGRLSWDRQEAGFLDKSMKSH